LLTVAQAAIICQAADQSLYRWLADAARKGRPLGVKQATWLIGKARLLDYVEKYQGGLPARVKAENLLREYWPKWSEPQELRANVKKRGTWGPVISAPGGKPDFLNGGGDFGL